MAYKAILILIVFGALAWIDLPGMMKNKQWRELAVYSVFFLLALGFTMLYDVFDISLSGFTRWLIAITSNR